MINGIGAGIIIALNINMDNIAVSGMDLHYVK